MILFQLAQKLGEDICYRCKQKIETVQDFSIEHKEPWLDVTPELFWDLQNIAFSHLPCNVGNRRRGVERVKGENGTERGSGCKRFLNRASFGRMNKKNYTSGKISLQRVQESKCMGQNKAVTSLPKYVGSAVAAL